MESVLWACDILAMVILVTWSARREKLKVKDRRSVLRK
jgi:hypothetical protein